MSDKFKILRKIVDHVCHNSTISIQVGESVQYDIPHAVKSFWASRTVSELALTYETQPKKILTWSKLFNLPFLEKSLNLTVDSAFREFCRTHKLKEICKHYQKDDVSQIKSFLVENKIDFVRKSTLPSNPEFLEFAKKSTVPEIAKSLNLPCSRVRTLLKANEIPFLKGRLPTEINDEIRSFCKTRTKAEILESFSVGDFYFKKWTRDNEIEYIDRESDEPKILIYPEITDEFKDYCLKHTFKEIFDHVQFKGTQQALYIFLNRQGIAWNKTLFIKMPKEITQDVKDFFNTHSQKELAEFYQVFPAFIHSFCKKHNLTIKPRISAKVENFLNLEITDALKSHFATHTKKELAIEYNINFNYICNFCKKHGLRTLGQRNQGAKPTRQKVNKIEMTDDLRAFCNSHTRQEIQGHIKNIFGVSVSLCVISNLIKKHDLKPIRSNGYLRTFPIATDEIRAFCSQHTRQELTKIYQTDYSSLTEWVRRNQIAVKPTRKSK